MKTFFSYDQQRHHPQLYFKRGGLQPAQEVPDRVVQIIQGLTSLELPVQQPYGGGWEPIYSVHDMDYIRFLQNAYHDRPEGWDGEVISNINVRRVGPDGLPRGGFVGQCAYYLADMSCPIGQDTHAAAYWSAQSAISAARAVMGGERFAYALCRPPGHHARRNAAGGFCYINNAAVAAELLKQHYGSVAILDVDVHHGQGTQEIFWERDDVLYVSIHGATDEGGGFYPVVWGYEDERGEGTGRGFNLNLPMPHGSAEEVFFYRLGEAFDRLRRYMPKALVLSLGFDIYREDPQSIVDVTSEGFRKLGRKVSGLDLPTVVVQEGGYHLESLAENTRQFFSGLLDIAA